MANERERLLAALGRAAAEQDALTPEVISRYAALPPDAFQEHFESVEQALIAAFDGFIAQIWLEIEAACDARDIWPLQVRDALSTVIASLVETSALARAFTIAAGSSLAANERRLVALDQFAARLREGRHHYPDAAALPATTELLLVSGVEAILSGRLVAEEPQVLPELRPQLTELILMPYVGADEARRVASV